MVRNVKIGDILIETSQDTIVFHVVEGFFASLVRTTCYNGETPYKCHSRRKYFRRPTQAELVAAKLLGKLPNTVT